MVRNNELATLTNFVRLKSDGDVAEQPCNLNGGSPLLHIAYSRITGQLFTGRPIGLVVRYFSAPKVLSALLSHRSRRVEPPGPMNTTKETSPRSPSPLAFLSLPFDTPSVNTANQSDLSKTSTAINLYCCGPSKNERVGRCH